MTHAQPTTADPEVLRCRSTADFLAALPQLTGFIATNSLLVVIFEGPRAQQALRIDLPRDESPTHSTELIDFVCETLTRLGCSDSSAHAPAIAIMSDQTFADSRGTPWRRFARRLERRLRRAGIGLRESCCQAPDGWVSYFDPAPPAAGRPLSDIDTSPIAQVALARGRTPIPLERLGEIPAPDPQRAKAIARALADDHPGALLHDDHTWLPRTVAITASLRSPSEPWSVVETASVLRSAAPPQRWFVMAVGLMATPEAPLRMVQERSRDVFASLPVCAPAWLLPGEQSRPTALSMHGLLAATCHHFEEPKRLEPVCDRLLQIIAEAPRELRPGVLALSAFLWWLRGSQSVAARHLDLAHDIDPAHEITHMLRRLTTTAACLGPQPLP